MANSSKPMSCSCEACKTRVKNWNGADPRCGFKTGVFSPDNWCCATLGKLRLLIDDVHTHNIFNMGNADTDEHYAIINNIDIQGIKADARGQMPNCLYVGWYKNRGCTQTVKWIYPTGNTRYPTEKEIISLLEKYGVKG